MAITWAIMVLIIMKEYSRRCYQKEYWVLGSRCWVLINLIETFTNTVNLFYGKTVLIFLMTSAALRGSLLPIPSVKSSMVYPVQALFFLPLTSLKNIHVAMLCFPKYWTGYIFMPCQEQKLLRLNRNSTLDLTLVSSTQYNITEY
jgi:hypothetical protein